MKITLETNEITRKDFDAILDIIYHYDGEGHPPVVKKKAATKPSKKEESWNVSGVTSLSRMVQGSESKSTIEDLRALVAKKVGDNREDIKTRLTTLGAKNVSSLEVEHYPAFKEFLEDL